MDNYEIMKKIFEENKDVFIRMLDLSPNAFFISKDQKCIFVNKFAANLLGFDDTTEIIGRDISDFIHPDYTNENLSLGPSIVKSKDNAFTYEQKIIGNNGKIIDVEITSTFLKYNNEDAIFSTIRDLCESKNHKKEIKKNEEFLRKINENMTDIISQTDLEGNFIYVNGPFKNNLGYVNEELIGKNVFDFLHIDDAAHVAESFAQMVTMDVDKTVECKYLKKDNTYICFEIKGKLMHDDNYRPSGIVFCARDISERKRAEELDITVKEKTKLLDETMEYDRLRTEFFGNISHEFRTPLNVILAATQMTNLLLTKPLNDASMSKINSYLGSIKQNSYRLVRLINNLIDVTRIDSSYFKINLVNCDIVNVVENITLSVAEYIEDKGINLIFDTFIEEKLIACDADKIERIMLNLLSNAIKFTGEGESIFVTMSEVNGNIVISVKDTGVGIEKEKLNLIFERFVQVDKSFARNNEGSGIGLSIVKALVEMHGGTIGITSEKGCGSEFIVTLPIKILDVEVIENSHIVKDLVFQKGTNKEKIEIEFSGIYFTSTESKS